MKFFVIGLGSIGKRHAKNLIALGHTVWGYDKNPRTCIEAAALVEGIEIAADMWDCDAYVICTPPDQHVFEIMNAIEYGKHVFVEKPIGVPNDIEPLGKMLEEAKRKKLVIMVGNMLRFHPEVRRIKPLVEKPLDAIFQVRQKNERYTEHVILNWGAHEIDLALYLLGPATKLAWADGNSRRAQIGFFHEGSRRSTIYMDYLTEPEVREFRIDVADDKGTVACDLRLPDWNEVYMDEMREFVAQILVGEPEHSWIGATGDDGLAALKIIAEAMRMADA